MDAEKEVKQLKEKEQRVLGPACFCWPTSAAGRRFWGTALLLTGVIWLLETIGLATVLLWPLLFIGSGFLLLLGRAKARDQQ